MTVPLVSILIPSYKPQHFEIALKSALAQTYEATEVIVSDDCPTEEIRDICLRYPTVNYSRNPVRAPNTNLIRLTQLARGTFIKYLLDDDILHPLCVGDMADALIADPAVKLVFSARDKIDTNNRVIDRPRQVNTTEPSLRMAGDRLRRHCILQFVNVVGEYTTAMYRRSDVLRDGDRTIYDHYHGDEIAGLTDIATFLQLCEMGDAVYLSDPRSYFRIHAAANSMDRSYSGFLPGIAEWAIFAKHAQTDPIFSLAERRQCLTHGLERFALRLTDFPQLSVQMDMMRDLLAKLPDDRGAAGQAGVG